VDEGSGDDGQHQAIDIADAEHRLLQPLGSHRQGRHPDSQCQAGPDPDNFPLGQHIILQSCRLAA